MAQETCCDQDQRLPSPSLRHTLRSVRATRLNYSSRQCSPSTLPPGAREGAPFPWAHCSAALSPLRLRVPTFPAARVHWNGHQPGRDLPSPGPARGPLTSAPPRGNWKTLLPIPLITSSYPHQHFHSALLGHSAEACLRGGGAGTAVQVLSAVALGGRASLTLGRGRRGRGLARLIFKATRRPRSRCPALTLLRGLK